MKVYLGQTRAAELIKRLAASGYGEVVCRGEKLPPRRQPFFYDNGAFKDFIAREPFNLVRWVRDLRWMQMRNVIPDFVVVPDIVAGGLASLAMSLDTLDWIPPELPRRYLVVQNGMQLDDVAPVLDRFQGLFVGGDLPWKLATAGVWIDFAHMHGLPCHVGRVGVPDRVRVMRDLGADSIDSSFPLWSEENLDNFEEAVRS